MDVPGTNPLGRTSFPCWYIREAVEHPQIDLYVIQQFYTLLTYGQMGYYAINPGVLNFSGASAAGPTYQELTDGIYWNILAIRIWSAWLLPQITMKKWRITWNRHYSPSKFWQKARGLGNYFVSRVLKISWHDWEIISFPYRRNVW
jgi:hypothetical protein